MREMRRVGEFIRFYYRHLGKLAHVGEIKFLAIIQGEVESDVGIKRVSLVSFVQEMPRHLHVYKYRVIVIKVYEDIFRSSFGFGNLLSYNQLLKLGEEFRVLYLLFVFVMRAVIVAPNIDNLPASDSFIETINGGLDFRKFRHFLTKFSTPASRVRRRLRHPSALF